MARTSVGRGGRGWRVGGHGLSDHAAARGWCQKSRLTNTFGTPSQINATMSFDQEPVGMDEPNTDISQRRRGSNIIKQVPHDPSKRTMISLDGGEFTDPKVSRKITSIFKTMFNVSWTTLKEVDKSARDELWAHFKELFK